MLWAGAGPGAGPASRRDLTTPWPVGIFPLDNVFFPVTEGQSPLGLPPGGLFWFRALCPLGWGPLARARSAVTYIEGFPLTSPERSVSSRFMAPVFQGTVRPTRHTPLRADTAWRTGRAVANAGRSSGMSGASSAFTIGDPSLGINLPVVMSAGSRASTHVPSSWRAMTPCPLHPESGAWYANRGTSLDTSG